MTYHISKGNGARNDAATKGDTASCPIQIRESQMIMILLPYLSRNPADSTRYLHHLYTHIHTHTGNGEGLPTYITVGASPSQRLPLHTSPSPPHHQHGCTRHHRNPRSRRRRPQTIATVGVESRCSCWSCRRPRRGGRRYAGSSRC